MNEPDRLPEEAVLEEGTGSDDAPDLSIHETRSERYVFTENENVDGWIATDLTVELQR